MGRLIKYWIARWRIYKASKEIIEKVSNMPERFNVELMAEGKRIGNPTFKLAAGKKIKKYVGRFAITQSCGGVQITRFLPLGLIQEIMPVPISKKILSYFRGKVFRFIRKIYYRTKNTILYGV